MGRINIDDLKSGMELAADLVGPNGRFLLPKGVVLDEQHLRIIKIWGITEADIRGLSAEEVEAVAAAEVDEEVLARAGAIATWLFRLANADHPAMAELRKLSVKRMRDRLSLGLPVPRPVADGTSLAPLATPAAPSSLTALDLVRHEVRLASFPDIYHRIVEVLNNPRSSVTHMADVVSKDPSLTAKLLRLVNSPLYGFPSSIDSISRAIALIGINELSMLALGVSVIERFKGIPAECVDMKRFWTHSIACGVFAKILAGHKTGLNEERFFLAGLIHDIGRLVILKNAPDLARHVFECLSGHGCLSAHAEQACLGFDHTDVADLLLTAWEFPSSLESMIKRHHSPGSGPEALEPAVIHVADIMARALLPDPSPGACVPGLDPEAWNILGFPPSLLAPAASQAEHQIRDIFQTFFPDEIFHG